MNLSFELRGIMPLLMHHDNIDEGDQLAAWRRDPKHKGVSVPGDDRSPAWTWRTYLYHDGESVAMPAANVMVALRQAGAQMILKKQKTYKEISQSGMLITSEFCDFFAQGKQIPIAPLVGMVDDTFTEQANAVRKYGFRLFSKRAKIGASKHIRVRPRFDPPWMIRGQIVTSAPELTRDAVTQLFALAGRVGLGDWRPGCKTPGPFGMFEATVTQA